VSRFITPLKVALVGEGRWHLVSPLIYESKVLGRTVTVADGFRTDFASVPRLPVVYLLFGGTAEAAAVVHDWLYFSAAAPRRVADKVFLEAARVTGVPAWRARAMYIGLRLFGGARYGVGSKLV